MKIEKLTLYTNQLEEQKGFYTQSLELPLTSETTDSFTVQVGSTQLTWVADTQAWLYHYCFLIPANQIEAAQTWLAERMPLLEVSPGQFVQWFEHWNARSVYFLDGAGNIGECIVRYGLENDSKEPFSHEALLQVNEIGTPSQGKVRELHETLLQQIGTELWKGDLERFATNGDEEGLFLLINNQMKDAWFPTDLFPQACPYAGVFSVDGRSYAIQYDQEEFLILELNPGKRVLKRTNDE
ncbi:MAG: glyoxalase [Bacteroidota bacterium]